MMDVNREAAVRMQQKMMFFRPPLPVFNVGDAIELQVRAGMVQRGTLLRCLSRATCHASTHTPHPTPSTPTR